MANRRASYAQNASGDFYVDTSCIDCDACRQIAPDHFLAHPDGHSLVHTQPVGPAERQACDEALAACPVAAIGNDGAVPAAPRMRELVPGVWACGYRSPATDEADAYVIVRPGGNWLVDVPAFDPDLLSQIEGLGDLKAIFISHDDHVGEAEAFKLHFGAEIYMHASEADAVPLGVDRPFEASFDPAPDLRILYTPGHSVGSSCLLWTGQGGCLFTGDTASAEAGRLAPVRFSWTADWPAQCAHAAALDDLPWARAFPARGGESCAGHCVERLPGRGAKSQHGRG